MVFDSPKRNCFASVIAAVLFLSGAAHGEDSPLRTYFVGNSVTDTIRYGSLAKLSKSRGRTLTWGRDMIPGAPLSWIWEHPKEGFQEEPFGLYPKALSEYPWDVLSLQPFDRHLDGKDGDLAMARNFIDLALKRSPDVQVYVYSRWPRKDKAKDGSLVLDYKTKWLRKYTGGWDGTEETRDYFERVVAGLRKAYEGKAKPASWFPWATCCWNCMSGCGWETCPASPTSPRSTWTVSTSTTSARASWGRPFTPRSFGTTREACPPSPTMRKSIRRRIT